MNLSYNRQLLSDICTRYQADYLGVFGSHARGDAKTDSDLDLLVRFSPKSKIGLFKLSAMRDDLQQVFNKKVDLLTEGFLSKHFRKQVITETKTLYDHT